MKNKDPLAHYECDGQMSIFDYLDQKKEPSDEYIKDNPDCFYVLGHYLSREQGWHKVPDILPTFAEWKLIDVVVFGQKTGTVWMEHGKWEAKDWTFRSVDDRRNTETLQILAWCLSEQDANNNL